MTEFRLGEEDLQPDDEDQPILIAVTRDHATIDEPSITYFGDDYFVDCGELGCNVERQADGAWELSFTIYTMTEYPSGQSVMSRKVPSNTLREQLWGSLGIRTRLAGHPIYPTLVGRLPCRPDPNNVLTAMTKLLATVDLDLLYTEPDDDGVL